MMFTKVFNEGLGEDTTNTPPVGRYQTPSHYCKAFWFRRVSKWTCFYPYRLAFPFYKQDQRDVHLRYG